MPQLGTLPTHFFAVSKILFSNLVAAGPKTNGLYSPDGDDADDVFCSELLATSLPSPFGRAPEAGHNLTRGTAMRQSVCHFRSGSSCT